MLDGKNNFMSECIEVGSSCCSAIRETSRVSGDENIQDEIVLFSGFCFFGRTGC
ncbi:hypothetical protein D3C78_1891070 [compost metagenome]